MNIKSVKALTDESIITFGHYKGKKLKDVPAAYLLDLYKGSTAPSNLRAYIKSNIYILRAELERGAKSAMANCRGPRK
jgi:uncharacterized protein (DUF3820 family)